MSCPKWITQSTQCHVKVWHPEITLDVAVWNALVFRSYGTTCFIRYQMIKEINIHDIHIFVSHIRRSKFRKVYRNNMYVTELTHDTLRRMWIHYMWPTRQSSKVEGNFVQGTRLTVIGVCLKMYIFCYQAVKINFKRICRLIPSGWGECRSTWHILSAGRNIWLTKYVWEMLEDPSLKLVHMNY